MAVTVVVVVVVVIVAVVIAVVQNYRTSVVAVDLVSLILRRL